MGEEDLSRAVAHDWTATLSGGVDAVVGIADVSESGRAQVGVLVELLYSRIRSGLDSALHTRGCQ